MTTAVGAAGDWQVPALGESWAHVPTQRVVLYWRQQQRHATLLKAPAVNSTLAPAVNTSTDHSPPQLQHVRFAVTVS